MYTISGNYEDESYFKEHIIPLIYCLYGLYPSIYKRGNRKCLELRYQSKGLIYFKKSLGLPLGKKKNVVIPNIVKDSYYEINFIRGLFDTDGCLCFKKRHKKIHYYPYISLVNENKGLITQVSKILERYNFSFSLILDRIEKRKDTLCRISKIELYGKNSLTKWMKTISSSNPKHLNKFKIWKEHGYLPDRSSPGRNLNPGPLPYQGNEPQ